MPVKLLMPSNHLSLYHPCLLLPSVFPRISVFSNESVLHIRWPKYWGFSFSISPSNEYSVLISFRMDWFDLLAVQGTLKSLLQHNSKAPILWCSAFSVLQLSHPYTTTGKIITLIRRTFVGKGNTHMVFPSKIILWIAHLFITVTSAAINCHQLKVCVESFPGGLVVGSPPANAGDMGSILVWENSTCWEAIKPMCHNYWSPCSPQLEKVCISNRTPMQPKINNMFKI